MRKIVIDSSSWVSYFLGLERNTFICQKMTGIIAEADFILIPEVVYSEVINVLMRLKQDEKLIGEVKNVFQGKKFYRYIHDYNFWFDRIELYSKKVILSTQDLLILAAVSERWPCKLVTGDKKLQNAYNLLKNEYENHSI